MIFLDILKQKQLKMVLLYFTFNSLLPHKHHHNQPAFVHNWTEASPMAHNLFRSSARRPDELLLKTLPKSFARCLYEVLLDFC